MLDSSQNISDTLKTELWIDMLPADFFVFLESYSTSSGIYYEVFIYDESIWKGCRKVEWIKEQVKNTISLLYQKRW